MSGLSTPLRPRKMPTPVGTATYCLPPAAYEIGNP